jgi:glucose-1-phosphate thymidylyltransferase
MTSKLAAADRSAGGRFLKGLILAAGKGTRLRPLTGRVSKPMLPLAGAPLISYPLRTLLDARIHDIGLVVGENEAELRAGLAAYEVENGGPARLTYIVQSEPQGLAHAVACARDFCGGDEFALLFCDNLFAASLAPGLELWQGLSRSGRDHQALLHTITVADPSAFGVAVLDEAGDVVHLEEKPPAPRSDQAVIGLDILTPRIFDAIARIKPSARGELEITDAILELTRLGHSVHARPLPGWWFDTGTFAALLEVLPPVMDELAVTATERISISPAAEVSDCVFEPPVLIGPGCRVTNSTLGPYVSIEGDAEVKDCTLERCLLYPGAKLDGVHANGVVFGPDNFRYPA